MSSLFTRLLAAGKGCPFCNFGPCNSEKCMFFIAPPGGDFDCVLLSIFAKSSAAAAYSFYSTLAIPQNHLDILMQLSPEALIRRLDRIQETLEGLDASISFPVLPEELKKQLEDARHKLSAYSGQVFSALEAVSPRQAKNYCVRRQEKS